MIYIVSVENKNYKIGYEDLLTRRKHIYGSVNHIDQSYRTGL